MDITHGVVDRKSRRERATRAVDVDADFLVRVLAVEEQQLRDHEVREVVVDLAAKENDPISQQSRAGAPSTRPCVPAPLRKDTPERVRRPRPARSMSARLPGVAAGAWRRARVESNLRLRCERRSYASSAS